MIIDAEQLPQWTISCHRLNTAVELKHILRDFTRGTYELYLLINGRKITIKYGMTADLKQGERMYRQIWRFPGWPDRPADYASGCDIDSVVNDLLIEYPRLTKDDLYVHVWDMSGLEPQNRYRPEHEPYILEGQLIEQHIDRMGHAPMGNKREQARVARGLSPRVIKAVTPSALLDQLFVVEE